MTTGVGTMVGPILIGDGTTGDGTTGDGTTVGDGTTGDGTTGDGTTGDGTTGDGTTGVGAELWPGITDGDGTAGVMVASTATHITDTAVSVEVITLTAILALTIQEEDIITTMPLPPILSEADLTSIRAVVIHACGITAEDQIYQEEVMCAVLQLTEAGLPPGDQLVRMR
jgi:hypothetical protein